MKIDTKSIIEKAEAEKKEAQKLAEIEKQRKKDAENKWRQDQIDLHIIEARAWVADWLTKAISKYTKENQRGTLYFGENDKGNIPFHVLVHALKEIEDIKVIDNYVPEGSCGSGCNDGCYGHEAYTYYTITWDGQPNKATRESWGRY